MSFFRRTSTGRSRRRRRDAVPATTALLRGLIVVALLAFGGWLSTTFYSGVPGRDYETVYAEVPRIGNLLNHDPVRIAGVRVGQVLGIEPGERGGVRLELQLEPGTTLPEDTQVEVRANGLLGARYIELHPGESERMLSEDDTITGRPGALTVGATEALDTFDGRTRKALGAMLDGLGDGLRGNGRQLNDALRLATPQMRPFQELAGEVLSRPFAAERLLPALERAVRPFAGSSEELTAMFAPAADAVRPFGDKATALQATLDEAPGALRAAGTGLASGTRLLGAARELASAAAETLPNAPAGLRSTTAMLRSSDEPLERAASLLEAAQPAVPATLRLAGRLDPLLDPLDRALARLRPMLDYVGPYGCDLKMFGANMRSMTGLTGAVGEGANGPPGGFRLQIVPSTELTGTALQLKVRRDGYTPPCHYRPREYPKVDVSLLGLRGGRR